MRQVYNSPGLWCIYSLRITQPIYTFSPHPPNMSSLTLTHPTPAHPLAVAPPQAHPLTTITEGVNKSNLGVVKHADAHARPAGAPTPSPKSEIVDADNTDVGTVNKKRKAAEIYSPEPKRSRNTAWEYGIRLQDAFAGEDWSIVDKWETGKPFSGIQEERAYRRFAGIMRNFKAAEADREAEAAEEAAADAEIAAIDAACDQEASAMDMRIAHGMTALTPLGVGVHTRFDSDTEDEEEEEETSAPAEPPAEPPAEKSEFIINTETNTVTLPMIDLTSSDSEDEEEPEAPEETEEPTNPQEPPQGNPTPQGNPQDKVTRFVAIHRSGKGQSVRLPPIDTPAPAPSLRPRKKTKSDALRKLMYEVSATWQASQRHVTEWRRV